ncbi:MAG: OadG family protein [Bacteroidales bacterium]|nr:OadG family protein [Bacteroidales bacterium]
MMTLLQMTEGAKRVMETDPHGWTLTLIAVTTVFLALAILFGIYTLSGNIFTGKYKRERKPKAAKGGSVTPEVAAAIALALDAERGSEAEVAIALALHLYLSGGIHDAEPGFLTIRRAEARWAQKGQNFRKTPKQ